MIDNETLAQVIHFHGHLCPGLALGIRAAEVALEQIGPHAADEEVVAIVETDMCGVDGVQFLTGCTFGKGNMIYRDYGKNAYTFVRRSDGRAIRISGRAGAAGPPEPGQDELGAKMGDGTATADDRRRFVAGHERRSRRILQAPIEELYDVQEVDIEMPRLARVFVSVECASCHEPTMETRIRRLDGSELCPPCFEAATGGRG